MSVIADRIAGRRSALAGAAMAALRAFVPQRRTRYEAGLKWRPGRGTLVTVAAFDIKGTNPLETEPMNGNNQIRQGAVTSRGCEVEAVRTVLKEFTVSLSHTHVDAQIDGVVERRRWSLSVKATKPLDQPCHGGCSVRTARGAGYRRHVIGTLSHRF